MLVENDEQRRFVLWSISRTVPRPSEGSGNLHPIDGQRPVLSRRLAGLRAGLARTLNLLATHPRRTAIFSMYLAIAVVALTVASFQLADQRRVSQAYGEILKASGTPYLDHPSRIVFQDPQFGPTDLDNILPYLKSVPIGPDIGPRMPDCRVFDFTCAPNIDSPHVKPLIDELEMTMIFLNGGQCLVTPDLKRQLAIHRSVTSSASD